MGGARLDAVATVQVRGGGSMKEGGALGTEEKRYEREDYTHNMTC